MTQQEKVSMLREMTVYVEKMTKHEQVLVVEGDDMEIKKCLVEGDDWA